MSQQLQELIHKSSHVAFYSGVNAERQRIIKLLTDTADRFDEMRPEGYKAVSNKADLRIRTIRAMIKEIEGTE